MKTLKQLPMKKKIIFLLALSTFFFSCKILQDLQTKVDPPDDIPTITEESIYKKGNAKFNYWRHSPMHVKNFQPVEFEFDISDNKMVKKVELYIYEYELFKDEQGLPSKRMREGGVWGLVQTWEWKFPRIDVDQDFAYNKGFPPESNVEYMFRVYNVEDEMTERFAMFDAGTSPWDQDKILLYAASRQPLSKTINVCFFADIDYKQNWDGFIEETERLIYEGYHANNMINERKELWGFYYTKQEADGYNMLFEPENEASYPPFMKNTLITGIDAFGLLHNSEYIDRTYFRSSFNFLSSNMFTSESHNWGTAVHETAHAVFRLSDEYNGCVCFEAERGANMFESATACEEFNRENNFSNPECNIIAGHDNQAWFSPERRVIFKTEEECWEYNRANNLPIKSCQTFINSEGTWSRSVYGICIMQDDGNRRVNNFQRTCQVIIKDYYEILEADVLAIASLPKTTVQNMFGYEPVVVLEMEQNNLKEINLNVKDMIYGVPTKNILRHGEMNLEFTNRTGEMMHHLCIDRPTDVAFYGGLGKNGEEVLREGSCILLVPFKKELSQAIIKPRVKKTEELAIKSVQPNLQFEFDLLEKIKKEYLELLGN